MRIVGIFLACLTLPPCASAWHNPAHARITRAAVAALPEPMRRVWAARLDILAGTYSLYPDLYAGATGSEADRLRIYCEKPDGKAIHNVTWRAPDDVASLEHVLNGIVRSLRANDPDAAAQYAGVLAHFLEDSTCPAHLLSPSDSPLVLLTDMLPPPKGKEDIRLHTVIERSTPEFTLDRQAVSAGRNVPEAADRLLERCYRTIKQERADLIDVVRAVYVDDNARLDYFRLKAARNGAELLSDALYTALSLAGISKQ